MWEFSFPIDRASIPLCYNSTRTMSTDEKILQTLEDLQAGQKALQADVSSIKDVQQKQGEQLEKQGKQIEALQTDVKTLSGKVDTVDAKVNTLELKIEAIHEYQKKAHTEIMASQEQRAENLR